MVKNIIKGFILGLILAGLFISSFYKNQNTKTISPLGKTTIFPTTPAINEKTKEYQDPSGFEFNYPEDLKVVAKETLPAEVYADISLTSNVVTGGIEIKILTKKNSSLESWLNEQGYNSSNSIIGDLTLADLTAKEIKQGKKIITVALDDYDTFYLIEVNFADQAKYWSEVNKAIVKSFAFTEPEAVTNNSSILSSSLEEDIVFEGEDVIE